MASSSKRVALSKKTRFDVFKRDGFICQYCGSHPPKAILECDHINPAAEGGTNDIDNLVTACIDCNRGKAAVPLSVVPQSLAEKAALVAEREAQLRGYSEVMQAQVNRLEDETWDVLDQLFNGKESIPRDAFLSTRRFIEKLGFFVVREAAEIALAASIPSSRLFRYFCGVCWNKVRQQDGADL